MDTTLRQLSSAAAIEAVRNGATLIDVRTEEEFEQNHAKNAVNIPVMRHGGSGIESCPKFLSSVQDRFSKTDAIVVICAAGVRSSHAAQLLIDAGFSNISNAEAGMVGKTQHLDKASAEGWKDAGGELSGSWPRR